MEGMIAKGKVWRREILCNLAEESEREPTTLEYPLKVKLLRCRTNRNPLLPRRLFEATES
jgi:hypothetical protein